MPKSRKHRVPASKFRIGVVAPGSPIDRSVAERVRQVAEHLYPQPLVDIVFHPQCFLAAGHFAGDDGARTAAFLEVANDPAFDALWFARGGYGACRLAEDILPQLTAEARRKSYLGYSDAGSLLAGLYQAGFPHVAHGPMAGDIKREGGEAAVGRALAYLVARAPEALEPSVAAGGKTAAFNIAILSHLIGTPWQPDLSGHMVMLEEVSEYLYRIDRFLCHITSNPAMRRVAGLRLGRCSAIPTNDPDFGQSAEQVMAHWCAKSAIPYLGAADIGHDSDNKVVPFGAPPAVEVS